jgi:hypothetical protein
MHIAVRVALVLVGLFVALLAVAVIGAESREVVVLHTTGADGASRTTRLWIVDDADGAWLRGGHDGLPWFRDLEARPDVKLERGGETLAVRAVPSRDPADHARINALTAAKYGWAESLYTMVGGGEVAIPIRLEPQLAKVGPTEQQDRKDHQEGGRRTCLGQGADTTHSEKVPAGYANRRGITRLSRVDEKVAGHGNHDAKQDEPESGTTVVVRKDRVDEAVV